MPMYTSVKSASPPARSYSALKKNRSYRVPPRKTRARLNSVPLSKRPTAAFMPLFSDMKAQSFCTRPPMLIEMARSLVSNLMPSFQNTLKPAGSAALSDGVAFSWASSFSRRVFRSVISFRVCVTGSSPEKSRGDRTPTRKRIPHRISRFMPLLLAIRDDRPDRKDERTSTLFGWYGSGL